MSSAGTKTKRRSYDYIFERAIAAGGVCAPGLKRVLRKLVRDAVMADWSSWAKDSSEARRRAKQRADRIAKELIP